MDEFRADVRKKLEEAAENKAKVETENAVMTRLLKMLSSIFLTLWLKLKSTTV